MFSTKLKVVMKELNLNQTKLSVLTGIGKSSISQYLSGKYTPTEDRQEEIAIALGLPGDYFYQEAGVVRVNCDAPIGRLRPEDAARLMGISGYTVRIGLQEGIFPWGYAIPTSENRWTYFINAKKFAEIERIDLSAGGVKHESKDHERTEV